MDAAVLVLYIIYYYLSERFQIVWLEAVLKIIYASLVAQVMSVHAFESLGRGFSYSATDNRRQKMFWVRSCYHYPLFSPLLCQDDTLTIAVKRPSVQQNEKKKLKE